MTKERIWKRPAHSTGTHLEAGVKYWITPHYNGPKTFTHVWGEEREEGSTRNDVHEIVHHMLVESGARV